MRPLVWVLEDDEAVREVINMTLRSRFEVIEFAGLDALDRAVEEVTSDHRVVKPAVLLADLQLGCRSFLEYLKITRVSLTDLVPFIVITGSDDLSLFEEVMAAGASDFLTKPFGPATLVGKINLIMKKRAVPFELDAASFVACAGDRRSQPLTSKEFQILSTLRSAPELTRSRQEIQEAVWNDLYVGNKTFDVHLHNLRKKVGDLGLEIEFLPPSQYRIRLQQN